MHTLLVSESMFLIEIGKIISFDLLFLETLSPLFNKFNFDKLLFKALLARILEVNWTQSCKTDKIIEF